MDNLRKILYLMLPIIAQIETNNDNLAVGDDGDALGHLQIHRAVVQDVNETLGYKAYQHEEMIHRDKANEVFVQYLEKWSVEYRKEHGRYPNELELARMWNGGPMGYRKKSTLPYMEKYREAKK